MNAIDWMVFPSPISSARIQLRLQNSGLVAERESDHRKLTRCTNKISTS